MKNIFKMMVCGFLAVNAINAMAFDEIELGVPVYGGSGCPTGSAYIALEPLEGGLTMRFDNYAAVIKSGTKMARVSCNLAIPLHVPQGYSVSVIAADYNGYLTLPKKAQARFSAEYFFAGSKGEKFDKIFTGAIDDQFRIESAVILESQVWSKCGEDTILRINSSILLQTVKKRDQAIASIDSASITPAVLFRIQTKRCE